MHLILALNNFVFNGINFLQTQGASSGTNSVPSFSTIFMGCFEEKFIYPFVQNLHSLYFRYIYDIFRIWTGTKLQFEQFIMYLNQQHPSIKFTYKISNEVVEFLDTAVYIDKNNQLQTKLYRKPADCQNYLHQSSHHPEKLETNIPFSQALRMRHICSKEAEFDSSGYASKAAFVERGYSDSEVKEQVNRAKAIIREHTLHSKEKRHLSESRLSQHLIAHCHLWLQSLGNTGAFYH